VNRFKNVVVAAALIFSIGLHWPILQSVAWLNMIVSYSQQDGFERAVVKTLDGKHPCNLCHFVAAGQKAEKKEAKQILLKKLDLISDTKQLELFGPEISIPVPRFSQDIDSVYYSPPTPPPNLV
jgi:hypothetical protein